MLVTVTELKIPEQNIIQVFQLQNKIQILFLLENNNKIESFKTHLKSINGVANLKKG